MFAVTLRSVSGLKRLMLKKASLTDAVVVPGHFALPGNMTQ